MQTDYICREEAINFFENMTWYHVNRRGQLVDGANSDTGLYKAKDVYKGLHDIPVADVAPVIHGRWLPIVSYNNTYKCSECGRLLVDITDGLKMVTKNYPYCHCGAKMEEGDEHETD